MPQKKEIERKFLVHTELLPELPEGCQLVQAYLSLSPTVRARTEVTPAGARRGYLTIKGPGLVGRDEFEYEIPYEEAFQLIRLSQWSAVSKVRHRLPIDGTGLAWEIDVFDGANAGLIVAEIELPSAQTTFPHPAWLGEDVSRNSAYKNSSLAQEPFSTWHPGGDADTAAAPNHSRDR